MGFDIMSHQGLISIFVVCFMLEFVAFGMQRATLLISREAEMSPQIGKMLLPSWFPIVWIVRICKWSVLIAIAFTWSWGIAIGLLVADVILSSILPIPYSIFIPSFHKRIAQIKQSNVNAGNALETILNGSQFHNKH